MMGQTINARGAGESRQVRFFTGQVFQKEVMAVPEGFEPSIRLYTV
jgi:hypothetical protein